VREQWGVRCPQGHQHGVLETRAKAEDYLVEMIADHCCGRGEYRVVSSEPIATCTVTGIINEHFNLSLGCPVRGKRHLCQLQKERGCHDYEPIKKRTAMYLDERNPVVQKQRADEAVASAAARLGDERARTVFKDDPAESVVFNEGD
jgi:hypothetical protein